MKRLLLETTAIVWPDKPALVPANTHDPDNPGVMAPLTGHGGDEAARGALPVQQVSKHWQWSPGCGSGFSGLEQEVIR